MTARLQNAVEVNDDARGKLQVSCTYEAATCLLMISCTAITAISEANGVGMRSE